MNDAGFVQILNERQGDGQQQNADAAEDEIAEQHGKQRQQRMHSDLISDDFRLNDISNHADNSPKHEQTCARCGFPRKKGNHRPGAKHRAAADNGEDIEHGNQRRNQRSARNTQNGKPDPKLKKSDEHDERIGENIFTDDKGKMGENAAHGRAVRIAELARKEMADSVKIHGEEHGGDNGDKDIDHRPRHADYNIACRAENGCGEGGERSADRGDKLLDMLRHGKIRVINEAADDVVQPLRGACEQGNEVVFEEIGQVADQGLAVVDQAQHGKHNQNADGAVEKQHEQNRADLFGNMCLTVQKIDQGLDQKRYNERDQKRHQSGKRKAHQADNPAENDGEGGKFN